MNHCTANLFENECEMMSEVTLPRLATKYGQGFLLLYVLGHYAYTSIERNACIFKRDNEIATAEISNRYIHDFDTVQ